MAGVNNAIHGAQAQPLTEGDPVVLAVDDSQLLDPSYLKTYFTKLDNLLMRPQDNPLRLFHDLEVHMRMALDDLTTIFAETFLQGYLVRIVQTVLERKYHFASWLEAAVDFLRLVVTSVTQLIAQRYHPEETLRALEKVFARRALFYISYGWNDHTDELRPKYFPSNQAERPPDAPELYAQVAPTDSAPSYWFLDMITTLGPSWEVLVNRINDAEHQLSAKNMYQLLKIWELIRNDLRKPFLREIVPKLGAAVLGHIRRFSDADLRTQSLDDILDCLNAVSKLAGRVALIPLAEEIELFKLALSVRCIQLPFLEARLKGIDQIKHVIQVAKGDAQHHTRARPRRAQQQTTNVIVIAGTVWSSISSTPRAAKGYHSDPEDESDDSPTCSRFSDGDIATSLSSHLDEPREQAVPFEPALGGSISPPHEREDISSAQEMTTFSTSETLVDDSSDVEASYDDPNNQVVDNEGTGDLSSTQVTNEPETESSTSSTTDSSSDSSSTSSSDSSSSSSSSSSDSSSSSSSTSSSSTSSSSTSSSSTSSSDSSSTTTTDIPSTALLPDHTIVRDDGVSFPAGQPPPPAGPPPRATPSGPPPPIPPKPKKRKGVAKLLTPQFVLNWIKENQILDIILKLEHEEALKQALSVLLFIAEQEKGLEESTLLAIWNVAKVHESHARVVYKHLSQLLEYLPSPQIDWLYTQIDSLPPEEYNPQVLTFIGDFTREAIRIRKKRGEELKLYGLEIFWQTLLKASKVKSTEGSSAIVSETVDHLEKLLKDYPDQRDVFLQRCIENLKQGEMVSVSLKLIKNILSAFKPTELNHIITQLNERSQLLDSLLTEFCRRAAHLSSSRAGLTGSTAGDAKAKPLEGRLSMLEFLLSNSGLTLSREQIFTLWDSLVKLPAADIDFVFEWLESAAFGYLVNDPFAAGDPLSKIKTPILSVATAEALFVEKICTLPKATFSMTALKLFRKFFLMVNLKKHALKRGDGADVKVRSFDLLGIQELWSIGMEAIDNKVALSALSLLHQLFTSVIPGLKRQSAAQQSQFATKSLSQMFALFPEASQQQSGSSHAQVQFERCLNLLIELITREGAGRHPSEIHGKFTKIMRPKNVKLEDIKLPAGLLPPLPMYQGPRAPPEGTEESPEAKQTRLEAEAKRNEEIRNHTEQETRLKREQIEVMKQRRAEINQHKLEQLQHRHALQKEHGVVPLADLLSENHLRQLIELLPHQATRARVWELIQLLPTPTQLRADLESLAIDEATGQFRFLSWLPSPESPVYIFWLLYILQLVYIYVHQADWRQRLLDSGRAAFFLNLFTQQNLLSDSASSYGHQALSYVVETIRELFNADKEAAGTKQFAVDGHFVSHLMTQLLGLASQQLQITTNQVEQFKPTLDLSMLPSLPPNKGVGTRFATTWYCSDRDDPQPKILTFELEPKGVIHRFTAAVYCVDYNTRRRHQSICCFLGEDRTVCPTDLESNTYKCELSSMLSDEFHEGIWVVWNCYGAGPINFQLKTIEGPNWIFPCVMLGPPLEEAPDALAPTPSVFPSFHLDMKTRGSWRGKYGRWGGVICGKIDHVLPLRPDHPADAPRIGKFERPPNILPYEWAQGRFTQDSRALQLIPSPEDMLLDDVPDPEPDPLENVLFPDEDKPPKPEYRDPIEDDRTRPPSTPAPPPPAPVIPAIDEEEEPLPPISAALLEMLLSTVLDKTELLSAVLSFPNLKSWLFDIICRSPDLAIRQAVVDAVAELDRRVPPEQAGCFLTALLEFLPSIGELRGSVASFTQFFALLQKLLDNAASTGLAVAYDKRALLQQLVVQLRDHPILEKDDSKDPDTALIGIIDLIRTVIDGDTDLQQVATQEYNLLHEIFGTCLFDCPADRLAPQTPKCKREESRRAAFQLLTVLVKKVPSNLLAVLPRLSQFLEQAPAPTDWSIDLSSKEQSQSASRGRYVGLKNQGCTCYLNATLQQLYIIPSLRRSILNIDLKSLQQVGGPSSSSSSSPSSSSSSSSEPSNIVTALHQLFAFMQASPQSFVDPINFCRQVRLNGEPIKMSHQEDALEFLNSFADQIEPFLKGLPQEHMLKETFGGRFIHQIISRDCPHRSEREEPYLAISVKVQNKRNLKESLENFVEGTSLDGNSKYKCEQCGPESYVVAKMRCCIEHLPNILIIHLKRFEFCFDTFENIKVNDHFEFPQELNMRPYTKEGLALAEMQEVPPDEVRPEDYYNYRLTGILIHDGGANHGHYYSYIKERQPADGSEAKWFEFNDTRVLPFDPDTIPQHCFGGKHNDSYRGTKSFSAYMLFYERASHYAPNSYGPPLGPLGLAGKQEEAAQGADKEVEPEILDKIFAETVALSRKRHIMSRPTLDFIWDAVAGVDISHFSPVTEYRNVLPEELSSSPLVQLIQMATRYLFTFISHCNDTHQLKSKLEYLGQLYALHLPSVKGLLETLCVPTSPEGNKALRDVIFVAPDDEVRLPFAEFISKLLRLLAPHEHAFINETVSLTEGGPALPKAISVRLIDTVIAMLTAVSDRAPVRLAPFLYILNQYGRISDVELGILFSRNAITDLLALYDKSRLTVIGAWSPKAPLLSLFELLADLVTSCDNPHNPKATPTGRILPPAILQHRLYDRSLIQAICHEAGYIASMRRIWNHWNFGNPDSFQSVLWMATHGCDHTTDFQHRKMYFEIIKDLLSLADQYQQQRTHSVMTEILRMITNNLRMETYRTPFVVFVFEVDAALPHCHTWLVQHDDLVHIYQTHRETALWIDSHQIEAYVKIYEERNAFIAAQAAATQAPPVSDAFHDSDDGEDEDSSSQSSSPKDSSSSPPPPQPSPEA